MNFRDQLKIDVQRTFINPNEFATIHMVDGVQIKAVVSEATDNGHPLEYAESVSLVRKQAHFDAAEFDIAFGSIPREGIRLTLDGVAYTVVKSSDDSGIYAVTLEANVD
jgi:hypothetical protein